MSINVIAPAVLMAVFIRRTAGLEIRRRIINISSGAARHPYAGWSISDINGSVVYLKRLIVYGEDVLHHIRGCFISNRMLCAQ
jgi:hypothetical protein